MGRGTNWTSTDDVEMCRSWLHVGQDPTVGTNQKFSHFWDKIMAHLKTKAKENEPERSVRAAQSRFALINTSVSQFVAAYAKAKRSAASGTNAVDLERRAMEIYRIDGDDGKAFSFKECWCVLKENPKWQCPVISPTVQEGQPPMASTDEGGSPEMQQPRTPSTPNSDSGVAVRPLGAKRTKSDVQQGKLTSRAVIAVESANLLATKRQRILQDQVALGYFRLQDADVAPEVREIFLKRRARLLKELDEEEGTVAPVVEVESPLGTDAGVSDFPIFTSHEGANLDAAGIGHTGEAIDAEGIENDFQCYGSDDPQGFMYMGNSNHGSENHYGNGESHVGEATSNSEYQLKDFGLVSGSSFRLALD